MMLEYLGWKEAAALIVSALEKAFEAGEATADLARFMPDGKPLGTKEFGECIMNKIKTS
jgi:isocitrate dehydrogenase